MLFASRSGLLPNGLLMPNGSIYSQTTVTSDPFIMRSSYYPACGMDLQYHRMPPSFFLFLKLSHASLKSLPIFPISKHLLHPPYSLIPTMPWPKNPVILTTSESEPNQETLKAGEPCEPTIPFPKPVQTAFSKWMQARVNKALFDSAKRSRYQ